jgi:simple sugar transport system substrate-binding protein
MQQAAQAFNVNFSWLGPTSSNQFSAQQMSQTLDAAIAQHPAALIVDDATPGLDATLKRVAASGIPVVIYITGIGHTAAAGAIIYIGNNEQGTGQAAGTQMAALGAKDALCVTIPVGESPPIDLRCKGFQQAFDQNGRKSSLVEISNPDDNQASRNAIEAALQKDRNVDAIFSVGAPFDPAILSAVAASPNAAKIRVGTTDTTQTILQEVKSGQLAFALGQQGYLQGYYAIQVLAQYVRLGIKPIEDQLPTGPILVDKSNVAQLLALCQKQNVC